MGDDHSRLSSGVTGLDVILNGGFISTQSYLIRGKPGSGKTTLGLGFLTAAPDDDRSLFINLGEEEAILRKSAEEFGFDLEGVEFLDMTPSAETFAQEGTYNIFASHQVEREPVAERIVETVDQEAPDRVFVDPVSQFRYLTPDDYQFHEQILSFVQFLQDEGATALLTSQATTAHPDDDLQFLCDGIVHLDLDGRSRSVQVTKFRGSDFRGSTQRCGSPATGSRSIPSSFPSATSASSTPTPSPRAFPRSTRTASTSFEAVPST